MARYFKIIELSEEEFTDATGNSLDCTQLVIPCDDGYVYVAADDQVEDLEIPLDSFDEIC